ncbi:hypothetical protein DFH08DRAFT_1009182 [Mycena albidolilacea]|uniref:Uncharacterized protein n=1 Tax=Mycena albidolilacea TaxID=1033008 RepID=A0AAD6ZZD2_9AGAR|nr:hypothetical protein DFH08DRAFT_1009182 [Mycena albidolilacea]
MAIKLLAVAVAVMGPTPHPPPLQPRVSRYRVPHHPPHMHSPTRLDYSKAADSRSLHHGIRKHGNALDGWNGNRFDGPSTRLRREWVGALDVCLLESDEIRRLGPQHSGREGALSSGRSDVEGSGLHHQPQAVHNSKVICGHPCISNTRDLQ